MSYSIDLRKKVVDYVNSGNSVNKACEVFQISGYTIYAWLKKYKTNGNLSDPKPNRPWKKIDPELLIQYVKESPGSTLSDFAKRFNVSIKAISLAFQRLNITRKKRVIYTKNGMKKNVEHFWKL